MCGEISVFVARADRQAAFHHAVGMERSCEEKRPKHSDQPASQRDHMRGPGNAHLGLVWVSSSMFTHVCVCVSSVHLVSAYFFMVAGENRKLWLAFTWFTWGIAGWANTELNCRVKRIFFLPFLMCEKIIWVCIYSDEVLEGAIVCPLVVKMTSVCHTQNQGKFLCSK